MLLASIVSAIATAIIAAATVVYVVVTKRLWDATLETAQRTQQLVRQSQEVFRLQLIATFLDETGRLVAPNGLDPLFIRLCRARISEVRLLLRESFPGEWGRIERVVDTIEHQMETEWRPYQGNP